MAVEKKVKSAKAASKTVANKKAVVKKIAVKKIAPKKAANKKIINVKVGSQEIASFTLTPIKPDGAAVTWPLVDDSNNKTISGVEVSFDAKSSSLQREFERAVLVVNLDKKSVKRENGHWRFVHNGVITDTVNADSDHDVVVELLNGGTTMVAYIHSTSDRKTKPENIFFGYVATYTDPVSHQLFTYESKDPEVIIKR